MEKTAHNDEGAIVTMPRSVKSAVVAGLCAFYFLSNVLLAHAQESNFWAERRRVAAPPPAPVATSALIAPISKSSLLSRSIAATPPASSDDSAPPVDPRLAALPHAMGMVKEVRLTTGHAPLVVMIQDIHMNAEAQRNIAGMIAALQTAQPRGARLRVGVEAVTGDFDFSMFDAIPERELVSAVADHHLDQKTISGPSFAGMVGGSKGPVLSGIDDAERYPANVEAYLSAVAHQEAVLARLAAQRRTVEEEKLSAFSEDLRRLDALIEAHRSGAMPFGDYVRGLVRARKAERAASAPAAPVVSQFLAAYDLESQLDFKRVERERASVIERLARRLSPSELETLVRRSVAYRSGAVSYADYYDGLARLMARHGIAISETPEFDRYVKYVMLAEGLKPDALLSSVEKLEASALAGLVRTDKERELVARSRRISLLSKLGRFSLTPPEWEELSSVPSNDPLSPASAGMTDFARFFEEADKRSRTMVDAMDTLARAAGRDGTAAMVVGGFHTPHMAALLREKGLSYAVVQPRLTRVEGLTGVEYLSVFTRDKTPLERLFEGEALFLAPRSQQAGHRDAGATTRHVVAPLAVLSNASIPGVTRMPVTEGVTTLRFATGQEVTVGLDGRRVSGLAPRGQERIAGRQITYFRPAVWRAALSQPGRMWNALSRMFLSPVKEFYMPAILAVGVLMAPAFPPALYIAFALNVAIFPFIHRNAGWRQYLGRAAGMTLILGVAMLLTGGIGAPFSLAIYFPGLESALPETVLRAIDIVAVVIPLHMLWNVINVLLGTGWELSLKGPPARKPSPSPDPRRNPATDEFKALIQDEEFLRDLSDKGIDLKAIVAARDSAGKGASYPGQSTLEGIFIYLYHANRMTVPSAYLVADISGVMLEALQAYELRRLEAGIAGRPTEASAMAADTARRIRILGGVYDGSVLPAGFEYTDYFAAVGDRDAAAYPNFVLTGRHSAGGQVVATLERKAEVDARTIRVELERVEALMLESFKPAPAGSTVKRRNAFDELRALRDSRFGEDFPGEVADFLARWARALIYQRSRGSRINADIIRMLPNDPAQRAAERWLEHLAILDRADAATSLSELGMEADDLEQVLRSLEKLSADALASEPDGPGAAGVLHKRYESTRSALVSRIGAVRARIATWNTERRVRGQIESIATRGDIDGDVDDLLRAVATLGALADDLLKEITQAADSWLARAPSAAVMGDDLLKLASPGRRAEFERRRNMLGELGAVSDSSGRTPAQRLAHLELIFDALLGRWRTLRARDPGSRAAIEAAADLVALFQTLRRTPHLAGYFSDRAKRTAAAMGLRSNIANVIRADMLARLGPLLAAARAERNFNAYAAMRWLITLYGGVAASGTGVNFGTTDADAGNVAEELANRLANGLYPLIDREARTAGAAGEALSDALAACRAARTPETLTALRDAITALEEGYPARSPARNARMAALRELSAITNFLINPARGSSARFSTLDRVLELDDLSVLDDMEPTDAGTRGAEALSALLRVMQRRTGLPADLDIQVDTPPGTTPGETGRVRLILPLGIGSRLILDARFPQLDDFTSGDLSMDDAELGPLFASLRTLSAADGGQRLSVLARTPDGQWVAVFVQNGSGGRPRVYRGPANKLDPVAVRASTRLPNGSFDLTAGDMEIVTAITSRGIGAPGAVRLGGKALPIADVGYDSSGAGFEIDSRAEDEPVAPDATGRGPRTERPIRPTEVSDVPFAPTATPARDFTFWERHGRAVWRLALLALVIGLAYALVTVSPDLVGTIISYTDPQAWAAASRPVTSGLTAAHGLFTIAGASLTYMAARNIAIVLEFLYRTLYALVRWVFQFDRGGVSFRAPVRKVGADGKIETTWVERDDGIEVDFLSSEADIKKAIVARFGRVGDKGVLDPSQLNGLDRAQLLQLYYDLDWQDRQLAKEAGYALEAAAAEKGPRLFRQPLQWMWVRLSPHFLVIALYKSLRDMIVNRKLVNHFARDAHFNIVVHLVGFMRDFFFKTDLERNGYRRYGRFINHFSSDEQARMLITAAIEQARGGKGYGTRHAFVVWYWRNNIFMAGLFGYLYRRIKITIFGMIGGWVLGALGWAFPSVAGASLDGWIRGYLVQPGVVPPVGAEMMPNGQFFVRGWLPPATAESSFLYRYIALGFHNLSFSVAAFLSTFFTAFGLAVHGLFMKVQRAIMMKAANPFLGFTSSLHPAAPLMTFSDLQHALSTLRDIPADEAARLRNQILDVISRAEALLDLQQGAPRAWQFWRLSWWSFTWVALGRYSRDETVVLRQTLVETMAHLGYAWNNPFLVRVNSHRMLLHAQSTRYSIFSRGLWGALGGELSKGEFWEKQVLAMGGMWTLGAELKLVVEATGDMFGAGYYMTGHTYAEGADVGHKVINPLEGEHGSAMALMGDLGLVLRNGIGWNLRPPPLPRVDPPVDNRPGAPRPGDRPADGRPPVVPPAPRGPSEPHAWAEDWQEVSAARWAQLRVWMRESARVIVRDRGTPVEIPDIPVDRNAVPLMIVDRNGRPHPAGNVAPDNMYVRFQDGSTARLSDMVFDPRSGGYAPPPGKRFDYMELNFQGMPGQPGVFTAFYTDRAGNRVQGALRDRAGRELPATGYRVRDRATSTVTMHWRDSEGLESPVYPDGRLAVPIDPNSRNEVIFGDTVQLATRDADRAARNVEAARNRLALLERQVAERRFIAFEIDDNFVIRREYARITDMPEGDDLEFYAFVGPGQPLVRFDPRLRPDLRAEKIVNRATGRQIVFTRHGETESIQAADNARNAHAGAAGAWSNRSYGLPAAALRRWHDAIMRPDPTVLVNLDAQYRDRGNRGFDLNARPYPIFMFIQHPDGTIEAVPTMQHANFRMGVLGVPGIVRGRLQGGDNRDMPLTEFQMGLTRFINNDSAEFQETFLAWYVQQGMRGGIAVRTTEDMSRALTVAEAGRGGLDAPTIRRVSALPVAQRNRDFPFRVTALDGYTNATVDQNLTAAHRQTLLQSGSVRLPDGAGGFVWIVKVDYADGSVYHRIPDATMIALRDPANGMTVRAGGGRLIKTNVGYRVDERGNVTEMWDDPARLRRVLERMDLVFELSDGRYMFKDGRIARREGGRFIDTGTAVDNLTRSGLAVTGVIDPRDNTRIVTGSEWMRINYLMGQTVRLEYQYRSFRPAVIFTPNGLPGFPLTGVGDYLQAQASVEAHLTQLRIQIQRAEADALAADRAGNAALAAQHRRTRDNLMEQYVRDARQRRFPGWRATRELIPRQIMAQDQFGRPVIVNNGFLGVGTRVMTGDYIFKGSDADRILASRQETLEFFRALAMENFRTSANGGEIVVPSGRLMLEIQDLEAQRAPLLQRLGEYNRLAEINAGLREVRAGNAPNRLALIADLEAQRDAVEGRLGLAPAANARERARRESGAAFRDARRDLETQIKALDGQLAPKYKKLADDNARFLQAIGDNRVLLPFENARDYDAARRAQQAYIADLVIAENRARAVGNVAEANRLKALREHAARSNSYLDEDGNEHIIVTPVGRAMRDADLAAIRARSDRETMDISLAVTRGDRVFVQRQTVRNPDGFEVIRNVIGAEADYTAAKNAYILALEGRLARTPAGAEQDRLRALIALVRADRAPVEAPAPGGGVMRWVVLERGAAVHEVRDPRNPNAPVVVTVETMPDAVAARNDFVLDRVGRLDRADARRRGELMTEIGRAQDDGVFSYTDGAGLVHRWVMVYSLPEATANQATADRNLAQARAVDAARGRGVFDIDTRTGRGTVVAGDAEVLRHQRALARLRSDLMLEYQRLRAQPRTPANVDAMRRLAIRIREAGIDIYQDADHRFVVRYGLDDANAHFNRLYSDYATRSATGGQRSFVLLDENEIPIGRATWNGRQYVFTEPRVVRHDAGTGNTLIELRTYTSTEPPVPGRLGTPGEVTREWVDANRRVVAQIKGVVNAGNFEGRFIIINDFSDPGLAAYRIPVRSRTFAYRGDAVALADYDRDTVRGYSRVVTDAAEYRRTGVLRYERVNAAGVMWEESRDAAGRLVGKIEGRRELNARTGALEFVPERTYRFHYDDPDYALQGIASRSEAYDAVTGRLIGRSSIRTTYADFTRTNEIEYERTNEETKETIHEVKTREGLLVRRFALRPVGEGAARRLIRYNVTVFVYGGPHEDLEIADKAYTFVTDERGFINGNTDPADADVRQRPQNYPYYAHTEVVRVTGPEHLRRVEYKVNIRQQEGVADVERFREVRNAEGDLLERQVGHRSGDHFVPEEITYNTNFRHGVARNSRTFTFHYGNDPNGHPLDVPQAIPAGTNDLAVVNGLRNVGYRLVLKEESTFDRIYDDGVLGYNRQTYAANIDDRGNLTFGRAARYYDRVREGLWIESLYINPATGRAVEMSRVEYDNRRSIIRGQVYDLSRHPSVQPGTPGHEIGLTHPVERVERTRAEVARNPYTGQTAYWQVYTVTRQNTSDATPVVGERWVDVYGRTISEVWRGTEEGKPFERIAIQSTDQDPIPYSFAQVGPGNDTVEVRLARDAAPVNVSRGDFVYFQFQAADFAPESRQLELRVTFRDTSGKTVEFGGPGQPRLWLNMRDNVLEIRGPNGEVRSRLELVENGAVRNRGFLVAVPVAELAKELNISALDPRVSVRVVNATRPMQVRFSGAMVAGSARVDRNGDVAVLEERRRNSSEDKIPGSGQTVTYDATSDRDRYGAAVDIRAPDGRILGRVRVYQHASDLSGVRIPMRRLLIFDERGQYPVASVAMDPIYNENTDGTRTVVGWRLNEADVIRFRIEVGPNEVTVYEVDPTTNPRYTIRTRYRLDRVNPGQAQPGQVVGDLVAVPEPTTKTLMGRVRNRLHNTPFNIVLRLMGGEDFGAEADAAQGGLNDGMRASLGEIDPAALDRAHQVMDARNERLPDADRARNLRPVPPFSLENIFSVAGGLFLLVLATPLIIILYVRRWAARWRQGWANIRAERERRRDWDRPFSADEFNIAEVRAMLAFTTPVTDGILAAIATTRPDPAAVVSPASVTEDEFLNAVNALRLGATAIPVADADDLAPVLRPLNSAAARRRLTPEQRRRLNRGAIEAAFGTAHTPVDRFQLYDRPTLERALERFNREVVQVKLLDIGPDGRPRLVTSNGDIEGTFITSLFFIYIMTYAWQQRVSFSDDPTENGRRQEAVLRDLDTFAKAASRYMTIELGRGSSPAAVRYPMAGQMDGQVAARLEQFLSSFRDRMRAALEHDLTVEADVRATLEDDEIADKASATAALRGTQRFGNEFNAVLSGTLRVGDRPFGREEILMPQARRLLSRGGALATMVCTALAFPFELFVRGDFRPADINVRGVAGGFGALAGSDVLVYIVAEAIGVRPADLARIPEADLRTRLDRVPARRMERIIAGWRDIYGASPIKFDAVTVGPVTHPANSTESVLAAFAKRRKSNMLFGIMVTAIGIPAEPLGYSLSGTLRQRFASIAPADVARAFSGLLNEKELYKQIDASSVTLTPEVRALHTKIKDLIEVAKTPDAVDADELRTLNKALLSAKFLFDFNVISEDELVAALNTLREGPALTALAFDPAGVMVLPLMSDVEALGRRILAGDAITAAEQRIFNRGVLQAAFAAEGNMFDREKARDFIKREGLESVREYLIWPARYLVVLMPVLLGTLVLRGGVALVVANPYMNILIGAVALVVLIALLINILTERRAIFAARILSPEASRRRLVPTAIALAGTITLAITAGASFGAFAFFVGLSFFLLLELVTLLTSRRSLAGVASVYVFRPSFDTGRIRTIELYIVSFIVFALIGIFLSGWILPWFIENYEAGNVVKVILAGLLYVIGLITLAAGVDSMVGVAASAVKPSIGPGPKVGGGYFDYNRRGTNLYAVGVVVALVAVGTVIALPLLKAFIAASLLKLLFVVGLYLAGMAATVFAIRQFAAMIAPAPRTTAGPTGRFISERDMELESTGLLHLILFATAVIGLTVVLLPVLPAVVAALGGTMAGTFVAILIAFGVINLVYFLTGWLLQVFYGWIRPEQKPDRALKRRRAPADPNAENIGLVHVGGNPMASGVIVGGAKGKVGDAVKPYLGEFGLHFNHSHRGRSAMRTLFAPLVSDPRIAGLQIDVKGTRVRVSDLDLDNPDHMEAFYKTALEAVFTAENDAGTTLFSLEQMYDDGIPADLRVGHQKKDGAGTRPTTPSERAMIECGFRIRTSMVELIGPAGSSMDSSVNFVQWAMALKREGLAESTFFTLIHNQYANHDNPKENPDTVARDNNSEIGQRIKLGRLIEHLSGVRVYVSYNHTVFGMKSSAMNGIPPSELPKMKSMIITDRNTSALNLDEFVEDVRRMKTNRSLVVQVAGRNTTNALDDIGDTSVSIELGDMMAMLSNPPMTGSGWYNYMRVASMDVLMELSDPRAPFRSWLEGPANTEFAQLFGAYGFMPNAVGISEDYWAVLQQYHNLVSIGVPPEIGLTLALAHKIREKRDHQEHAAAPGRWSAGYLQTQRDPLNQQAHEFGPSSFFEREARQKKADLYVLGPIAFLYSILFPIAILLDLTPFVGISLLFWVPGVLFNQITTLNRWLANNRTMGFWLGTVRFIQGRIRDFLRFPAYVARIMLAQFEGWKGPSMEFKMSGGAATDRPMRAIWVEGYNPQRPIRSIIATLPKAFKVVWNDMVRGNEYPTFLNIFVLGLVMMGLNIFALSMLDASNVLMMLPSLMFSVGVAFGPFLSARKRGTMFGPMGQGEILFRLLGFAVGFGVLLAATAVIVPLAGASFSIVGAVMLALGVAFMAAAKKITERFAETKMPRAERAGSEFQRGFYLFVAVFGWFMFTPAHPIVRFDLVTGFPMVFTPIGFLLIIAAIMLVYAMATAWADWYSTRKARDVQNRFVALTTRARGLRGIDPTIDAKLTAFSTQLVTFVIQEAYIQAEQVLVQTRLLIDESELVLRTQITDLRERANVAHAEHGDAFLPVIEHLNRAMRHTTRSEYEKAREQLRRAQTAFVRISADVETAVPVTGGARRAGGRRTGGVPGALGVWQRFASMTLPRAGWIEGISLGALAFGLLFLGRLALAPDAGLSGVLVVSGLAVLAAVALYAILYAAHRISGVWLGGGTVVRDPATAGAAAWTALSGVLVALPVLGLAALLPIQFAAVGALAGIAISGWWHGRKNAQVEAARRAVRPDDADVRDAARLLALARAGENERVGRELAAYVNEAESRLGVTDFTLNSAAARRISDEAQGNPELLIDHVYRRRLMEREDARPVSLDKAVRDYDETAAAGTVVFAPRARTAAGIAGEVREMINSARLTQADGRRAAAVVILPAGVDTSDPALQALMRGENIRFVAEADIATPEAFEALILAPGLATGRTIQVVVSMGATLSPGFMDNLRRFSDDARYRDALRIYLVSLLDNVGAMPVTVLDLDNMLRFRQLVMTQA